MTVTDTPNDTLPAEGRAALRAGVVGNYIDNVHMFLPLVALPPALAVLAGPQAVANVGTVAGTGALVVIAMLLGRPIGGVIFGRISDRIGRAKTTRIALAGTVVCTLAIALLPTYQLLGMGTIALIIVFRFIGGICIAGEYSAAIPLAMEWSKPPRRGLMSGLILSMAAWAQGSIAFFTAAGLALLGPQAYATWGWRILFLAGALASVGMIIYYQRHVDDSPAFHRAQKTEPHTPPAASSPDTPALPASLKRKEGVRELLIGSWRGAFWQVFLMMTGLWLLTLATVLTLPGQIAASGHLDAGHVALVMGCASVGQAIAMAFAGHLSTGWGRQRLFMVWGTAALIAGPWLWLTAVNATGVGTAMLAAITLQMVTVAAYGPVSAYLSERFPTRLRSTAYGMTYSWSLVLPALYPFYLPSLAAPYGPQVAIVSLLVLGACLVIVGAWLGPKLSPKQTDTDIDSVSRNLTATTEETTA